MNSGKVPAERRGYSQGYPAKAWEMGRPVQEESGVLVKLSPEFSFDIMCGVCPK